MLDRAVSIALALLLAVAGALGATQRTGATPRETHASCCGGNCQCGDACQCAVGDAPASPDDGTPALPERSRGERAPLVAATLAAVAAVTLSETVHLGAMTVASSDLPAPPSCRLRLALVSRWTT